MVAKAHQLRELEDTNNNLLLKKYNEFEKKSNIFKQTHFEILYKVDQMMNSHLKVKDLKDCFSELVSFGKYSLAIDVQKVLQVFIDQIENEVKSKTMIIKTDVTDEDHKEKLLKTVVLDLLERAYATFHDDVTILVVKFIGSKSISREAKTYLKRNKLRMQKLKRVTDEAIRLLKDDDVIPPTKNDASLSLLAKFRKIKSFTANVETFNKLAEYDFSLDETEIEAIADIVNLKLIVNFEGITLTFGSSKNFFNIPGLFSNDDKLKQKLTAKEIHRILKPYLKGSSLENFRKEISKKITSTSKTREMIQNPHRNLIKNLGMNGGEYSFL